MSLTRRHFFFGSLALPAFAAKKPPAERPSLMLMVVDDLPSWVLGSSGNREIRTPALDRLAQTGARFSNHYACTPAAALSRATLMTGRTPMQLRDSENPPAAADSLEKIVGGLGYAVGTADSGKAGQFLEQQTASKPFLLTVGCPYLHPPYEGVAQKYHDLYAQTRFDSLNAQRVAAPNAARGKEMFADLIGSLRQAAAAVTAFDDDVGAIFTTLSQRRLLDSTLIIFTSTCGALLGRHGLWDAGEGSEPVNMYDEVVVTPMIWSWPGHIPAQAVRPEMVSTYDFVPTMCDLLEAERPVANLCGRSYVLLATGKPLPKKEPWRKTVFGHFRNTDMAREERYKLVVRAQGPGELYDLTADPTEKVNQFENPQFMTVRGPLADQLTAWKYRYS
ncbi:MAG TPA: sulfatase-like hydrolase/transferase [Bryobacteraceae bacterium]|nr:sulfatase-like hydrolase/transferase [Bryobacteraceae bacterium]